MKGKTGLGLLLALFSLAFVCALLSGAGRLLGGQETQQACTIPTAACIRAVAPGEAEQSAAPSAQEAVRRVCHSGVPQDRSPGAVCAQTDANGNVLRGESYLRTVYCAFTLGDGFA